MAVFFVVQESYIQRLVLAMEEVFFEQNKVQAGLVADVHQYIFRSKGVVLFSFFHRFL